MPTTPSTSVTYSCPICDHPVCEKITEIYFDYNQDNDKIVSLFNDFFNTPLTIAQVEKHFSEHVDRTSYDYHILKQEKVKSLQKKSEENSQDKFVIMNNIQEILWERMVEIHASSKQGQIGDKEIGTHAKQSKELCDLIKSFRDNNQQLIDMVGMGQSEEEQKEIMEKYVVNILSKAINLLSDLPEAQKRLSEFISTSFEENM